MRGNEREGNVRRYARGFRIYETPFVSSRYLFASNVRIFKKEEDAKYPDLRRFRRLGQNVPLEKVVHDIATVHLVFNLYNVAQRKTVQSVSEEAIYERRREKYLYRDGFARALLLHFSREQLVLPLEHVVLFA